MGWAGAEKRRWTYCTLNGCWKIICQSGPKWRYIGAVMEDRVGVTEENVYARWDGGR